MIRTLLATTALASVLATGAFAQDAAPAAAGQQQVAATANSQASQGQFLQQLSQGQYLASNINGSQLFSGDGQNAQAIGDIQNFLVNADGMIAAVIVDAGEFVGEARTIAIPFDQITWTTDENNQPRGTVTTTQEQLAQAPAFEESNQQAAGAQQNASGQMAAGQPAADPATQQAAPANQMAAGTAPAAGAQVAAASGAYPSTVAQDQHLTENLIGQSIYSGPGEDAESVGDMNDLILASSGQVIGAVVGVGGFLGIGEKDVGLPFEQIQFSRDADGESRAVAQLTKEQLEQAPEFIRRDNAAVASNASQPATQGTAAGGAAAGAVAGVVATQSGDQPAGSTEMAANSNGMATSGAQTQAPGAQQSATTTTAVPVQTTDAAQTQQPVGAAETSSMTANSGTTTENGAAPQQTAAGTTQDNMSTAAVGGDQRRQGMTPVQNTALSADNLMGTTVYGPNDENIGEVGDIALTADGGVDAIIVDVGGFLGIGAKPVAVAMDNLQFMQDANGSLFLYTQFTQDQLEAAPEYNRDSYADSRNSMRLQSGPAGQQAAPAAQ